MKRRTFLRALLTGSAAAVTAALVGPSQLGAVPVTVIKPEWLLDDVLGFKTLNRKWSRRGIDFSQRRRKAPEPQKLPKLPFWSLYLWSPGDEGDEGDTPDVEVIHIDCDLGLVRNDIVHHANRYWWVVTAREIKSMWEMVQPVGLTALAHMARREQA